VTRPTHPAGTFVGLYGSHGSEWRREAKAVLEAAGIPWHDPSDPRWDGITHENGDQHQALIDQLVSEETEGLLCAGCTVFHLAGGPRAPTSLAARFELGLLAGRGLPAFVHVEPDALGRNYLWAAMTWYPNLVRCSSIAEAVRGAVERVRSTQPT
jgi:hypothetical protein